MQTLSERFTEVYKNNTWCNPESRSGEGSTVENSKPDREFLLELIRTRVTRPKLKIVDVPCGDMKWMPLLLEELSKDYEVTYHGFDVVEELVADNRSRFAQVDSPVEYSFEVLDVTACTPPKGDILICRDLLNHLANADIHLALERMRASGTPLLVVSNNERPNWWRARRWRKLERRFQALGNDSRYLNICEPPFNFGESVAGNGHLALWEN